MNLEDNVTRIGLDVSAFQGGAYQLSQLAKGINADLDSIVRTSTKFGVLNGTFQQTEVAIRGLTKAGKEFNTILKVQDTEEYGRVIQAVGTKVGELTSNLVKSRAAADALANKFDRIRTAAEQMSEKGLQKAVAGADRLATKFDRMGETAQRMAANGLQKAVTGADRLANKFDRMGEAAQRASDRVALLQQRMMNGPLKAQQGAFAQDNIQNQFAQAAPVIQQLGQQIGGANIGNATAAQLGRFSTSLGDLTQKVALGKIKIADLNTAFNALQTGGLQNLPPGANAAAKAILGLNAQAEQFGIAGQRAANSVGISWQGMVRLLAVSAIHKAFSQIIGEFTEGARAAAEFQIKISEIRTIAGGNQLPFDQWANSVRGLSDAFNAPLKDVTEGVYETLSNQVASGAKSFEFMTDAMKFSKAAVSSTADAVNLLSSALNSYKLPVEETTRISAIFFKTIDLGRVRANEMADSFGRIGPLAHSLGITLEETAALVATLTRQGIKFDEASTQITAIMNALIKPTKTMRELLATWGTETGEAAIATFGFSGVLDKLAIAADKGNTEVSKLFQNIRGRKGIVSVIGDKSTFKSDLDQISNSFGDFQKAVDISMESAGFRVQKEVNKIKNYFTVDLGQTILSVADLFGGSFSSAVIIAANVIATLGIALGGLAVAYGVARIATMEYTAVLAGNPWGIAALAVGVLAVGIGGLISAYQLSGESAEEFGSKSAKAFEDLLNRQKAMRAQDDTDFNRGLDRQFQAWLQFSADVNSGYGKMVSNIMKDNEELHDSLIAVFKNVTGDFEKSIQTLESTIKKAEAAADKAAGRKVDLAAKHEEENFERGVEKEPNKLAKAQLRFKRADDLLAQGDALHAEGNHDEANKKYDQAKTLLTQQEHESTSEINSDQHKIGKKDPVRHIRPVHYQKPQQLRFLKNGQLPKTKADQESLHNLQQEENERVRRANQQADDKRRNEGRLDAVGNQKANKDIISESIERQNKLYERQQQLLTDIAAKNTERAKTEKDKLAEQKKDFEDYSAARTELVRLDSKKGFNDEDLAKRDKLSQKVKNLAEKNNVSESTRLDFNDRNEAQRANKVKEIEANKDKDDIEETQRELAKKRQELHDKQLDASSRQTGAVSDIHKNVTENQSKLAANIAKEVGDKGYASKEGRALYEALDVFKRDSSKENFDRLQGAHEDFSKKNKGQLTTGADDATFDETTRLLVKLNTSYQAYEQASEDLTKAELGRAEVEKTLAVLSEKYIKAGNVVAASEISFSQSVDGIVNRVYDLGQAILNASNKLNGLGGGKAGTSGDFEAPGKAQGGWIGGGPNYMAGGGWVGRGSDIYPVMAARGEYMVQASSAMKYRNEVEAINHNTFSRDAGNQTNLNGDLHVHINGTTDPHYDGRQAAQSLRRELRRGTSSLKGRTHG